MATEVIYLRSKVNNSHLRVLAHNHVEVIKINDNGMFGMEKITSTSTIAILLQQALNPVYPLWEPCTAKDFENALGSLVAGLQGLLPQFQQQEPECSEVIFPWE